MGETIDLDQEIDNISKEVLEGMKQGRIDESTGLQLTLLCTVGAMLLELGRKLDDTNEMLDSILESIPKRRK
jgi:hypothetical protein